MNENEEFARHLASIHKNINIIKSVVFIDGNVSDSDYLVESLSADNVEVVILDLDKNGVTQITEILSTYSDLESIQIVSHGQEGKISIGNTILSDFNIDSYQEELHLWGDSLVEDGDILLYGCSVASEHGVEFINKLSMLTNADVAASDNITGADALGGDWLLEVATGEIENETLFVDSQYPGVLPSTTFTGDLNANNQFYRPDFTSSSAQLTSGNISSQSSALFNYFTVSFSPSLSGNYNIVNQSSTGTSDTFLIVYENSFDPNSPLTNWLQGNDDWSSSASAGDNRSTSLLAFIEDVPLSAGNNYIIVMTTYDAGGTGNTTFTINGAGTAIVNAAPTTADGSVSTPISTDKTFSSSDFSFTDSDVGDALSAIKITSLETAGTLFLDANSNGTNDSEDITQYQEIALADISKLTFSPIAAASGTPYATFDFKVSDGKAYSELSSTMTINVSGVSNTAPVVDLDGDDSEGIGSGGFADSWTEGSGNITIADSDSDITDDDDDTEVITVTVSLTNDQDGVLEYLTSTISNGNVTVSDNNTDTITLTNAGSASTADFEAVLEGIQWVNTSENPDTTSRTVTVVANDGTDDSNTATTTISVTAVNNAPTLSGGPYTFTATDEDTTTTGVLVSTILGGTTNSDPESDTLGVAVTTTTGNGTWQFSTDDTTWTAFGSVSGSAALLLDDSTYVRYVPDGDNGESAAITFAAWDQTSGTASTNGSASTADVTGGGSGTSPYSSGTAQGTLVVDAINDDPTLTGLVSDITVVEDTASNVDLSAVTLSDVDSGSNDITLTITAGAGTLAASDSGGVTIGNTGTSAITLTGTVSEIDTYLNTASNIQYTGASDASGNDATTLTITANDGGNSGTGGGTDVALGTVNVDITGVNDAPTLSAGPYTFTATDENTTTTGVLVSTILGGTTSSDPDNDTLGVAVTTTSGNGTWQFSTDNSTWTAFGSVSGSAALLLDDSTYVRYVPDGDNGESAAITFAAWDQTSGTASTNDSASTADVTGGGSGTSPYSSGTAQGTLVVDAINDDPTLTGLVSDITVVEDTASNVDLSAVTLSDVDSGSNDITLTITAGAGTLAASDSGGVTIGNTGTSAITLTGTVSEIDTYLNTASNIQYTGASDASGNDATTLTITANDGGNSGTGGGTDVALGTVNVDITGVNDAPTLSAGPYTFTATDEDTTTTGVLVSTILGGTTSSDPDNDTLGVAVTTTSGNGTWQFSTDNSTWTAFGSVSGSAALLLDDSTYVRYVPDGDNGESAAITFAAWDQTSGTASTNGSASTADVTGGGSGTSPYSSGTAQGTLVVDAINDDPTLTGLVSDITVVEDTASNVDLSAVTLSDVDSGSNDITLTITAGAGTLAASDSGGVTIGNTGTSAITLTGTVSEIDTYLNTASNIQYTGASDASGNDATTLTITANDGGNSGTGGGTDVALGTVNVDITGVNDAPTLSAGPYTFTATDENTTTTGVLVSTILGGTTSSDPDNDTLGVAVTTTTGNGTWQFSTDDTTWTAFGSVSGSAALLLDDSTYVRYIPDGDNGESAAITFAAWDQTSGTASTNGSASTADVTGGGSGTSPYSSGTAQGTLVVDAINDDPTLTGLVSDITVVEDTASNVDLSAVTLSDVDSGSNDITLTITAGAGTLAASDSGGVTIGNTGTSAITLTGTVSEIDTYLNTASNIQYTGASDASGNDATTLTITANDGGNSGTGGGTDVALGTVNVDITGVNDAPTLSAGPYTFTATDEDTTTTGVLVSTILGGTTSSDPDNDTLGVAVTTTTGNGTWQFSTDNSTWTAFGSVSGSAALLLDDSTYVRYIPDGDNGESAAITFAAWDQTSGTASTNGSASTADVTGGGSGTSPYSSGTAQGTLVVDAINDDPTLTGLVSDITVVEDTASNVDLSAVTLSDVDSGSNDITLTITAGAGTLAASDSGGVTIGNTGTSAITLTGTVSEIDTYLNTASNIQYTGASDASGNDATTLTITANDGGNSGTGGGTDVALGTVNVDITGVNDAPTLSAGPYTFTATDEDTTTTGVLVSTILGGTTSSDPDNDTLGVAVTTTTGNGTWQFSTDNSTWTAFGSVSGSAALLLDDSTYVRYVPDGDNGESAAITFAAWDQTSGTASTNDSASTADVTGGGSGTSPYSSGTAQGTLVVDAINDDPTLTGLVSDITVVEDTASNVDLSAVTLSDVDSGSNDITLTITAGAGTLAASDSGGVTIGNTGTSAITLTGTVSEIDTYLNTASNIQYTGASDASGNDATTLTITANDGGNSGTGGGTDVALGTVNVDITGVNDAPTLSAGPYTFTATDEDTTTTGVLVKHHPWGNHQQ